MQIQSCLSPIRIKKPNSNEFIYVPCGKCEACRQAHNQLWIHRLTKESNSWPYQLFITLTYNDTYLPIAKKFGTTLVGQTPRHSSDNLPVLSREDFKSYLIAQHMELDNNLKWFDNADVVPYTSVADIQGFIKRLRKKVADAVKKYKRNVPKEKRIFGALSTTIRYFAVAEIGPTTFRPHYHLILWFSSELLANNYKKYISEAWSYGFNRSEFALKANDTASYCAKYVNCFADLPAIYSTKPFRPKSQFSRFPALGTLSDSPTKIRDIFDNCSCKEVSRNAKDNTFIDGEIWRYYKDKLFPKLTGFDSFSHIDRVALYRAASSFGQNEIGDFDFEKFDFMLSHEPSLYNTLCGRYYRTLLESSKTDDFYPVKRWFYVSSRVITQAESFGVSLRTYIEHIEKFYKKLDYEHLKDFYRFQEEFSKEFGSDLLFGMYLDSLKKFFVLPSEYATDFHAFVLDSFGIPPDSFFGLDPEKRKQEFGYLFFENNIHGIDYRNKVNYYFAESTKVKKKNDYNGTFGSAVYNLKLVENGR